MPRSLKALAAGLTLDELRHLLVVKEKLSTLEKRRAKLEKELAKVETQIAKLIKGDKRKLRAGKTVKRKPATRKKTVRAKSGTAKKAVRKKVPVRKKAARKPTVETVVADLIRKHGEPMMFKEILSTIKRKKLVKTKSKNFANVLRRTISTSTLLKRKGRGIYGLK